MTHLLWKEWRERRLLALVLLAATVCPVLLGQCLTFCGDGPSSWTWYAAMVAALLGCATFSGEIAGETASTLFCRPVFWWQVLAAKVLAGMLILAGTVAAAATAYLLSAPPQYAAFVTGPALLRGAAFLLLVDGCFWLAGFAASAVLPGTMSSAVVLGGTFLTMGLPLTVFHSHDIPLSVPLVSGMVGGFVAGGAVATLLLTRHGLTESPAYRMRVYIISAILIPLVVSATAATVSVHLPAPRHPPKKESPSISPSGRWVTYHGWLWSLDRWHASKVMQLPQPGEYEWLSCDIACVRKTHQVTLLLPSKRRLMRLHVQTTSPDGIELSPDRRLAAVAEEMPGECNIEILDVHTGKQAYPLIKRAGEHYWWASPGVFAWQDANEAKHRVVLSPYLSK